MSPKTIWLTIMKLSGDSTTILANFPTNLTKK